MAARITERIPSSIWSVASGTSAFTCFVRNTTASTDTVFEGRSLWIWAGNLYGVAEHGGASKHGTAFELARDESGHWSYHKLYYFCLHGGKTCRDGSSPSGLTYVGAATGVPYDGASTLYGTTLSGGSTGGGIAFALTPVDRAGSWSETVVYSFCAVGGSACADGLMPGSLLQRRRATCLGSLSGAAITCGDGGLGAGTVFELSRHGNTWTETVLHAFCDRTNCSDGAFPNGPLTQDARGNFFGVTANGGRPCTLAGSHTTCGVVFSIDAQRVGLTGNRAPRVLCREQLYRDGAQPVSV